MSIITYEDMNVNRKSRFKSYGFHFHIPNKKNFY